MCETAQHWVYQNTHTIEQTDTKIVTIEQQLRKQELVPCVHFTRHSSLQLDHLFVGAVHQLSQSATTGAEFLNEYGESEAHLFYTFDYDYIPI